MEIEEFKKNKLRECLEEQGCSEETISKLIGFLPKHPKGDFSISYQKLCSIIDEAVKLEDKR